MGEEEKDAESMGGPEGEFLFSDQYARVTVILHYVNQFCCVLDNSTYND
jgi:hypothetical protein